MILDESHRWGEVDDTPVCLDCGVEGYEDVPAAFAPCVVGSPSVKKTRERKACPATLVSRDDPSHTHRCIGGHDGGNHFCADCRRWFGTK